MPLPFLHRLLSLLLAVLVLSSSVGFTVQRQTCRMSGRSQVKLALPGAASQHECGPLMAEAPTRLESSCCDFSSQHHQVTSPAPAHSISKVPVPPMVLGWLPVLPWPRPSSIGRVAFSRAARLWADDRAPPRLSGRALLAFVGVLVVLVLLKVEVAPVAPLPSGQVSPRNSFQNRNFQYL